MPGKIIRTSFPKEAGLSGGTLAVPQPVAYDEKTRLRGTDPLGDLTQFAFNLT